MQGPEKNSYKEFDNEEKFLRLENSPPPFIFAGYRTDRAFFPIQILMLADAHISSFGYLWIHVCKNPRGRGGFHFLAHGLFGLIQQSLHLQL